MCIITSVGRGSILVQRYDILKIINFYCGGLLDLIVGFIDSILFIT